MISTAELRKLFLDYFAKENNITSTYDWNKITRNNIKSAGGSMLLQQYPSFYECLKSG